MSDNVIAPGEGSVRPAWLPRQIRAIPVAVVHDVRHAAPMARALAEGGVPCAEVTLRTPDALAVIEAMAQAIADGTVAEDFALGAGTVLNSAQAADAISAGARYIVSPGLDEGVWDTCVSRGVPVVPGVATASEVQKAYNLGARLVKFFPASTSGGTAALKALAAPFSMMQFIPTGGISLSSAPDWLSIPAVIAVGGSWLSPGKALAAGDLETVRTVARDTAAALAPKSTS